MAGKKQVTFYILFPKNTEEDCVNDHNKLGTMEQDRNYVKENCWHPTFTFFKNEGFKMLEQTIKLKPDKLHLIRIINSEGKKYTVSKFLDILGYCNKVK